MEFLRIKEKTHYSHQPFRNIYIYTAWKQET